MSLGFESNGTLRKERKKTEKQKMSTACSLPLQNTSCAEVKHFLGQQPSLVGVVLEEGVQVGTDKGEETAAVLLKLE